MEQEEEKRTEVEKATRKIETAALSSRGIKLNPKAIAQQIHAHPDIAKFLHPFR